MPERDYYLPQRRLVSQDDAAIIQSPNVPRSKFTGHWTRKTTFDAGYIVPIMLDEILPGDHMSYQVTAYVRLSTPLFPLLDNQRIDTFFFFVPSRILWANWARFMGEQIDPDESINLLIPTIDSGLGGFALNTLYDHMGIPCGNQVLGTDSLTINALPFRAYNIIYNQWFRDENLIDSRPMNYNSNGPDLKTDYVLQKRAKAHDYFTSALPWPQKFTPPTVPLAGTAPVRGIGFPVGVPGGGAPTVVNETIPSGGPLYNAWSNAAYVMADPANAAFPLIYADLSAATGVAINTFRQAFLVQQLLERDARGGTRYVELIRAHFGVTNPDFRLQRPEYIGGGQTRLVLTPVAQTAPSEGVPVGALGAAGTAAGSHRASYAATEHGYILGLINVRSELSYQQGLPKVFSRSTRYDFYWPSLSGLGEQAILQQEIYADGSANDVTVFGYQERWHEYRTRYSDITGYFRSTTLNTLDVWHLAQKFTGAPVLGQTFIEDDPPMERVLALGPTADNQQYLADIMFERTAVRAIPTFGTPVTLGRF